MQVNVYTVSQINGYIKRLIENDVFLSQLYIEGEISNFKQHTSGHLYLTLKDETGSIDCVMFRSFAATLGFMPKIGESVLVRGRVSLYEKTGKYQLYVEYMQPAGLGVLYMAFEQMKKRLEAEGLFDGEHKKPIPAMPKTVAVVTSPTGAAVRDIINVCGRRNPTVGIVVVPVLVQGENAAEDIAKGIEKVNRWGGADVIIVGRGGGSKEDLWAFNEEVVARAIFASKIPVISAVGHQIDVSISDFVADMAAPTPSAAAELAVPASEPLGRRNKDLLRRMQRAVGEKMKNAELHLKHALGVKKMRRPLEPIFEYQIEIEELIEDMKRASSAKIEKDGRKLEKSMAAIENLSPMNVVKRGYALVYDKNGAVVNSVTKTAVGDEIRVGFKDGSLSAVVKTLEEKNGSEKTEL